MSEKNKLQGESNTEGMLRSRRRVLEMIGGAAVAVPVVGLTGCGGGDDAPASSAAPTAPAESSVADAAGSMAESAEKSMESMQDDMAAAAEDAMDSAEDMVDAAADKAEAMVDDAKDMAGEMADDMTAKAETIATDAGGMAQVDENGAKAMGLGYRHDATSVDASVQTRYQAGQQCSNCALYQGGAAEWGGCPLFAGQQVKGTGWCSAYAPGA